MYVCVCVHDYPEIKSWSSPLHFLQRRINCFSLGSFWHGAAPPSHSARASRQWQESTPCQATSPQRGASWHEKHPLPTPATSHIACLASDRWQQTSGGWGWGVKECPKALLQDLCPRWLPWLPLWTCQSYTCLKEETILYSTAEVMYLPPPELITYKSNGQFKLQERYKKIGVDSSSPVFKTNCKAANC